MSLFEKNTNVQISLTHEELEMVHSILCTAEFELSCKIENAKRFRDDKFAEVCEKKFEILKKIKEKVDSEYKN